jgi:predicted phage terminase large subunit-like protein
MGGEAGMSGAAPIQIDEAKLREQFLNDPRLVKAWTPKLPKFVPYQPRMKQWAFLLCDKREVLIGGEPGGGKSACLLMAMLQYVDVPGYAGIVFRRNLGDLTKPGGVKWLADQWLAPYVRKEVFWDEANFQYKFACKGGGCAYLQFAHMQYEKDKYRMKGSAYQRYGFDELTEFSEGMYSYAFRSFRESSEMRAPVPMSMRSTTNPGGEFEDWVVKRFAVERATDVDWLVKVTENRVYIDIRIEDGALNAKAYREVLEEMEPIERERLLNRKWGLKEEGLMFKREAFKVVPAFGGVVDSCRAWDLAASTKKSKHGHSADWTVGQLWGRNLEDDLACLDQVRGRWAPDEGDAMILDCAERDGKDVMIVLPQEPGQAGLRLKEHYEKMLQGYPLTFYPQSQNKRVRAHPYAAHANKRGLYLVEAEWNSQFIDEHCVFTGMATSVKDDSVDVGGMAYRYLLGGTRVTAVSADVETPFDNPGKAKDVEGGLVEVAPWEVDFGGGW